MTATDAEVVAMFVAEAADRAVSLASPCSFEPDGDWVTLGHLPRLAALKATKRGASEWDYEWWDEMKWNRQHLRVEHAWGMLEHGTDEMPWLLQIQLAGEPGALPITVISEHPR